MPNESPAATVADQIPPGAFVMTGAPMSYIQTMPISPQAKSILESKTFWGLVIGIGAPVLAKHGIIVDPGIVTDIVTAIGALLAIYGRFTASQPLTMKK